MKKREPSAKKPRGARTRRQAPAASAALTSVLTLDTAMGLQVGDHFKMAGGDQVYRVTKVGPGPCITFDVLEAPAWRFWWPWVAALAGIVGFVVWAVVR